MNYLLLRLKMDWSDARKVNTLDMIGILKGTNIEEYEFPCSLGDVVEWNIRIQLVNGEDRLKRLSLRDSRRVEVLIINFSGDSPAIGLS